MDTVGAIISRLESLSTPEKRDFLPYFFKTGKGQYGEGDKFLGVVVPDVRRTAKEYKETASFADIAHLLADEFHECRLCGLLILVEQFKRANEERRGRIVDFYLSHTSGINNWDLVDLSAPYILGEYLADKTDRGVLYRMADSSILWEQRIAVVSTIALIRRNDFTDIIALSERLLHHKHDLMHKAIGWMLRESGKRDKEVLTAFLDRHYKTMPRTMLRYSIERLTPDERHHYMTK
jgi:3-methyladenine DNA glycosylase AlkD